MKLTKVCGVCKKRKPDTDAYFSSYTTTSGNPSRRGTCKTCMSDRAKRHHKERPDLRQAALTRRRQRVAAADGSYSEGDIARIRRKLNDSCFYCGASAVPLTVDHLVPISKGGSNWPTNLTLACKPCNFDKHGKTAEAFVRWRLLHEKTCTRRALALVSQQ